MKRPRHGAPETAPPQRELFGASPVQGALDLNTAAEASRASASATDATDAALRFLNDAAREATCARRAAAGTSREYALVEATRILEAARCACLNARTLLVIPVPNVDPDPESEGA